MSFRSHKCRYYFACRVSLLFNIGLKNITPPVKILLRSYYSARREFDAVLVYLGKTTVFVFGIFRREATRHFAANIRDIICERYTQRTFNEVF